MTETTERYIPYEVYKNLGDFLTYRNVEHDYQFLSEADFMKQMMYVDYIKIQGTRDDRHGKRPFIIVLISPESKVALNTPNFKKLMNSIPNTDLDAKAEIVIVSEKPLTSFIMAQIHADKMSHPGVYIENYEYVMFAIVMPKHSIVPRHTIASPDEVERFCTNFYTKKERLASIYANDTGAVWIGARPGDVIKIERESEAVGKAIGYRIVVRAPV